MSKTQTDTDEQTVVAYNRRATFDFEILEKFEAGIVFSGSEVKSVRGGGANLKQCYVRLMNGEIFLVGCHVTPYRHGRPEDYNPERDRKLLMHRKEIERVGIKVQQKGLTLIPMRIYTKGGRLKLEFGLGRGKKFHDKRDDVKKREAMRDVERVMSHSRKG